MNKYHIGFHVNKTSATSSESFIEHYERFSRYIGDKSCLVEPCFQVFVVGPKSRSPVNMDYEKVRAFLEKHPASRTYAHSNYMSSPWSLSANGLETIAKEFEICAQIGITGLVVHLPKKNYTEVLDMLPTIIEKTRKPSSVQLILEHTAVLPNPKQTYETPEKINRLMQGVENLMTEGVIPEDSVGFCLDTAHLWSSGQNISTGDHMRAFLSKLDCADRITLVHLNDNERNLGVCGDKHANILNGQIWNRYGLAYKSGLERYLQNPTVDNEQLIRNDLIDSGFAVMLEWCRERQIPAILERNASLDFCADINVIRFVVRPSEEKNIDENAN